MADNLKTAKSVEEIMNAVNKKDTDNQPKQEALKATDVLKPIDVKEILKKNKELAEAKAEYEKQLEAQSQQLAEAIKKRKLLLRSILKHIEKGIEEGYIIPEFVIFAKKYMTPVTLKGFEQRLADYKKDYGIDVTERID